MCYKAGLLLSLHISTQLEMTSGESGLAEYEYYETSEMTAESTSIPMQNTTVCLPSGTLAWIFFWQAEGSKIFVFT